MFRRPVFWAAFAAFSAACAVFAVVNFPRAFSIVELDLEMDRTAALSEARRLAGELGWGPTDYRQAASFRVDDRARSFVELEGGGPEAFAGLLRDGPFHPYQWVVRHFRGGEVREAEVRFRAGGAPYGFRETLAEDAEGAALDADAARAIAEAGAGAPWNVALDGYEPVEASLEERPGGRVDHTFVYERTGAQAGEGRFRLRLVVSGDRLTELTHVLQVPEAFDRRYEAMRSANEGIGVAGSFAMLLIYGGGLGVGLFLLLRQRRVLWRKPLVWGVSIAFAQLLAGLNQWPLLWMGYDTALSETSFAIQQVAVQVGAFLAFAGVFTLSFMAAESLSRRAFPHHLQLWRCWSREGARSWTVLGQTVAGYLIVGIDLAFLVSFYWITVGYLGWWSPSDALVNPDSLATVVPWFSPLAILPAGGGSGRSACSGRSRWPAPRSSETGSAVAGPGSRGRSSCRFSSSGPATPRIPRSRPTRGSSSSSSRRPSSACCTCGSVCCRPSSCTSRSTRCCSASRCSCRRRRARGWIRASSG